MALAVQTSLEGQKALLPMLPMLPVEALTGPPPWPNSTFEFESPYNQDARQRLVAVALPPSDALQRDLAEFQDLVVLQVVLGTDFAVAAKRKRPQHQLLVNLVSRWIDLFETRIYLSWVG